MTVARNLLLLAMPLLSSYAQGVTGIVSGYVYDTQAKVVRPVNGLPGAASLGDPVSFMLSGSEPATTFDRVEFTGTDLAYAVTAGQFYSLHLSASTAESIPTAATGGRLAAPGLIWFPDSRQLQFIANGTRVFVASDGSLTASGLDPVSGCATLAFDSGTVELVCGNNQTRLYADDSARITYIAFASSATFVLDVANQQVVRLNEGRPPAVLATGYLRAVGLVAVNASLLAVADAGTQQLTFIALDGGAQPAPVALLFPPSGLRASAAHLLRLGPAGANPFEIVDCNHNYRNFFVPSAPGAATALSNTNTRTGSTKVAN